MLGNQALKMTLISSSYSKNTAGPEVQLGVNDEVNETAEPNSNVLNAPLVQRFFAFHFYQTADLHSEKLFLWLYLQGVKLISASRVGLP